MAEYKFYKNNPDDKVYWVDNKDVIGEHLFSFDKKKVFNLFRDFPMRLTKDQVKVFCAENPEWAQFFADRLEGTT